MLYLSGFQGAECMFVAKTAIIAPPVRLPVRLLDRPGMPTTIPCECFVAVAEWQPRYPNTPDTTSGYDGKAVNHLELKCRTSSHQKRPNQMKPDQKRDMNVLKWFRNLRAEQRMVDVDGSAGTTAKLCCSTMKKETVTSSRSWMEKETAAVKRITMRDAGWISRGSVLMEVQMRSQWNHLRVGRIFCVDILSWNNSHIYCSKRQVWTAD